VPKVLVSNNSEVLRHLRAPSFRGLGLDVHVVASGGQAQTALAVSVYDLVLIDAGCESDGYAADISRTYPVNGRFSAAQRDVYDIVLAAQAAAIDQVRAGRPFQAYHEAAVEVLTRGLIDLGLLEGTVEDNIEQASYRRFYMHKTGHWLGLDVHDVGDYRIEGESRVLEKNMVVTVEPGLYIGAEDDIPEALRNIGIRIEDDIRVTADAPDNLTADVPSDPDRIETVMAR